MPTVPSLQVIHFTVPAGFTPSTQDRFKDVQHRGRCSIPGMLVGVLPECVGLPRLFEGKENPFGHFPLASLRYKADLIRAKDLRNSPNIGSNHRCSTG